MKKNFLTLTLAFSLLIFNEPGVADEKVAQPEKTEKADAKAEFQELFGKIQTKLQAGKRTEQELAEEIKQFDALLARYQDEKSDDVAQILFMKAMLYLQVFEDAKRGVELFKKLRSDFPETARGKQAEEIIAKVQKQAEGKKIQAGLVVGAKFPDFEEKDTSGKPLAISQYKGKIVLIDFWATWCGPCIAELPNVLKTYEKYHGQGFEIIGISLDQEEEALTKFTKTKNMPWPQFFDGKGWGNKLAEKYGIQSIPATYLLDGEGKILAKDRELRGPGLEAEVGKALGKL